MSSRLARRGRRAPCAVHLSVLAITSMSAVWGPDIVDPWWLAPGSEQEPRSAGTKGLLNVSGRESSRRSGISGARAGEGEPPTVGAVAYS